jgi:hypothetical protein
MFLNTGVSTRQACTSPVPTQYKVYVRPRGFTPNCIIVLHRFWLSIFAKKDLPLTPRLLGVQRILPLLGQINSVPSRSFG